MPRLAANLTMLFTDVPFLERFGRAAACGFRAVEFLFPYDHPADEVAAAAVGAGVEVVLFNAPPGEWEAGERGVAALPGREREHAAGIERAAAYAVTLGCPRIHVMSGIGGDLATYRSNLAAAGRRLAEVGAIALVEALNHHDMPGYLVADAATAIGLVAGIDRPDVRLQADLYHFRRHGADPVQVLREHLGLVGHVQIAGVPDRHEPSSSEDAALLGLLDELGYGGLVGCEYHPAAGTEAGLGWAAPWGISPARRR